MVRSAVCLVVLTVYRNDIYLIFQLVKRNPAPVPFGADAGWKCNTKKLICWSITDQVIQVRSS